MYIKKITYKDEAVDETTMPDMAVLLGNDNQSGSFLGNIFRNWRANRQQKAEEKNMAAWRHEIAVTEESTACQTQSESVPAQRINPRTLRGLRESASIVTEEEQNALLGR